MKKSLVILAVLALISPAAFGSITQVQMQDLMAGLGMHNLTSGVITAGNVVQGNSDTQSFDGKNAGALDMSSIVSNAGTLAGHGDIEMLALISQAQQQAAVGNTKTQSQGFDLTLVTSANKESPASLTANNTAITNMTEFLTGIKGTTSNSIAAAASTFIGGAQCSESTVCAQTNVAASQCVVVVDECPPVAPCAPQSPCGYQPPYYNPCD